MSIPGYATVEGTRRYRDRMLANGTGHARHFREGLEGLVLSSIGLGTYLGESDDATDALYLAAIQQAIAAGCNVLDSAVNYRCQRSERVIGHALAEMVREGACRRDELLIATKGGYLPYDGAPPRDKHAYIHQNFVAPGLIHLTDLVFDCHCLSPTYLRHQVDTSLANLGLSCLDVYYLHNPETQLHQVSRDEFMARMRAAFEVLEEAVSQGKLRVYGTATWEGYRGESDSRGHLSLEALVRAAKDVAGEGHHFKVVQLPYNLVMPEALVAETQELDGKPVTFLEAARAFDLYVMASASIMEGRLRHRLPRERREALGDGTDAQRSIQFVRSTPGIGTALVGMKQASHVRDNLALAGIAPLPPEQIIGLVMKRGESRRVLIYDGECRLCVAAKGGLERLGQDQDIRFVPYQSEEAASHLGKDYQPGRPGVAYLVDQDGTISRGLDAFLPLLPGLPGGRILSALMRFPPLRPLSYLAYRIIARYRYKWFGQVG